jgi:hypothetical protein
MKATIYKWQYLERSRDRPVGIATGYGLDDWGVGVRVPVGSRIIFSPRRQTGSGPPNLLSNGYRRLTPRGKAPPASDEVKKMWIYASTPPYAFME